MKARTPARTTRRHMLGVRSRPRVAHRRSPLPKRVRILLWQMQQMQGLQTQMRHVTLRPNLPPIVHHNHGYYRRCRHKKNCHTNNYSNGNGESLTCNLYKLVFHAMIQHLPAWRVPGPLALQAFTHAAFEPDLVDGNSLDANLRYRHVVLVIHGLNMWFANQVYSDEPS